MSEQRITVQVTIKAPVPKVWEYYTAPGHIQNWNQASPDWHCPTASNNLTVGGKFSFTMAAKDGSISFDFWGTYITITPLKLLHSTMGDGRDLQTQFETVNESNTTVTQIFEPETENTIELQEQGWQSILNSFKQYVENN